MNGQKITIRGTIDGAGTHSVGLCPHGITGSKGHTNLNWYGKDLAEVVSRASRWIDEGAPELDQEGAEHHAGA